MDNTINTIGRDYIGIGSMMNEEHWYASQYANGKNTKRFHGPMSTCLMCDLSLSQRKLKLPHPITGWSTKIEAKKLRNRLPTPSFQSLVHFPFFLYFTLHNSSQKLHKFYLLIFRIFYLC